MVKFKAENLNIGGIWTMLAGTVIAVVYMFTTFVTAAEFAEFRTDMHYLQYYELLEKYEDAEERESFELADELMRQMERLKAKICEEDPKWERCEHDPVE